jgi:hypothetical protein
MLEIRFEFYALGNSEIVSTMPENSKDPGLLLIPVIKQSKVLDKKNRAKTSKLFEIFIRLFAT